MPTLNVNLGDVQSTFTDLPLGEYLGEIEKVVYMPPREIGKHPQLRCQYLVVDGDHINQRQSQFLSLSPKAMGFVKEFFAKFGLGDYETFEIDDDTNELVDPDLTESQVIFKVAEDAKAPGGIRTALVTVEELGPNVPDTGQEVAAPAPAPVSRAAAPAPRPQRPAPAPVAVEETTEDEDTVDADAATEPEPEAVAPAPAPRRPAPPAPAARPAPQRRTLR